jgi:RNA polymerase sigma-70 factor (ECF subfamily)
MTMTMTSTNHESELLAAARGGDEDAFRRLVGPYRAQMHAHCYRMLGSVHDAEDVLQTALLRTWRGLAGFDGRSAFRTWLYRIATNACLDVIRRRPKRVLPIDYGPPSSPTDAAGSPPVVDAWVDPYPDDELQLEDGYAAPEARYEQREAVELAFVAALQHLPPRQRAVLILREVLGFSATEVADALGSTRASVNSALQRARRAVEQRIPERSQQATARSLGDEQVQGLVERFSDALQRGDTAGILAVLAEDVTFSMPPYASWCRGRDAVADSWLMPGGEPAGLRYLPTRANGQPAVAAYKLIPDDHRFVPLALDVLTLRGSSISEVTAFRTPELFGSFGLPSELAA